MVIVVVAGPSLLVLGAVTAKLTNSYVRINNNNIKIYNYTYNHYVTFDCLPIIIAEYYRKKQHRQEVLWARGSVAHM